MPLVPGCLFGPYEVVGPLGAGGMGEVWRAKDTRLDREVALKLLPLGFANDSERVARFAREARTLAAVSHPGIAAVYGFEELEGLSVLAMELVEGEDLCDRIGRGPVPLDEVLVVAKQVAEALETAHEKGIVHRDLKPANIKLAADGRVKLLDFGLAKAWTGDAGRSPEVSNSPTLLVHGTAAGVILGTAGYMSPEQARGKPVDKRADVWAFGVVLFELLTGQPMFQGETVSDVLAGVLTKEVDWSALPPATPPPVVHLLRRCLERDARQRLRDIGEARIALGEATRPESAPRPPAGLARSAARRGPALAWMVAAVGVAVGAAGLWTSTRSPSPRPPVTRVALVPAEPGEITGFPAVSPDGRTLLYVLASQSGPEMLWAHSLDSGTARKLPGTERAADPFWSPDGRQVGFFSDGKLRRLDLATGASEALCDVGDSRGGTWTSRGEVLFTPQWNGGLYRVAAAGGTATAVTTLEPASNGVSDRYPWALPGGTALLFARKGDSDDAGVYWLSLTTGTTKRLAPEVSRAAYGAAGALLWVRQGQLVAQPLDAATGTLSGAPLPIGGAVGADAQITGKFFFGLGSTVIACREGGRGQQQLVMVDRAGKTLAEVTSPGRFFQPAMSPDGTRVAVGHSDAQSDIDEIWVYAVAGKDRGVRLSFGSATDNVSPIWSADGLTVLWGRERDGAFEIVRKNADGSGPEEVLLRSDRRVFPGACSPREPLLVFQQDDLAEGHTLWLLPLAGERTPRRLVAAPGSQGNATFSPDGRLVAYPSNETGSAQIYVQEVAEGGGRWQVTTAGGDQAAWRADGKELFYVDLERTLRAVPVRSLAPFSVEPSAALFPLDILRSAPMMDRSSCEPGLDGQRFLVDLLVDDEAKLGLSLVLNWQRLLDEQR